MLDESTYRIVNKARQLGFSWIIAAEAVFEMLTMPNHTILIVSTGENSAKRVLGYCYKIIRGIKFAINLTKATQEEIAVENGSRIMSLPNNPNTVRGFNAGRVYIDESAHFIKDRDIFQAIQPSISRGGKMTLSSTPRGRANIFYEKWTDDDDYSHHRVHYTECPDKKYQHEVAKMRRTMYELDFKQEYCCEFMADEMAMFPRDLIEPCIDMSLVNSNGDNMKGSCFLGIDFAKKVDSTVLTVAEAIPGQKIVIRFLKELKNMPYEASNPGLPSQMKEITRVFKSFKVQRIKMDATGVGVKLEEDLIRMFGSIVEGVRFGTQEKEGLITNLRIAFEKQLLRIPNDEQLISQLMSLERHVTETGIARYKHVQGKHDDYVWSLALCVSAATIAAIDIGYYYVGETDSHIVNEKAFESEQPSIIAF